MYNPYDAQIQFENILKALPFGRPFGRKIAVGVVVVALDGLR